MVCTFRDHSTSSRCVVRRDSWTSLEEMLWSRHQMSTTLKSGTSINRPLPSRVSWTTRSLLTLRMQEDQTTCTSGIPTEDGSNASSTSRTTSRMFKMVKLLVSEVTRTWKAKVSMLSNSLINSARNGKLTMLTKLKTESHLVFTLHTRSILVDHSSSGQDCQCKEYSLSWVEETWSKLP
jgi:hypothetical protein